MPDRIASFMAGYTDFKMTGDRIAEINSLAYLPFETRDSGPELAQRLVLVLVEPRLLDASGNADLLAELMRCLERFKGDLRAEGLVSRFILADLYRGPIHKDGQIVLALRRFFQDVKSAFPNFEGVILLGNFPEATLCTRVAWSPSFVSPRALAIDLEMVASRADIVLGDLSGNWESLYHQASFDAERISAEPDAATTAAGWYNGESVRNCEFSSTHFDVGRSASFCDAFYLDDAIYTILKRRKGLRPLLRLRLNQAERNAEVDHLDHTLPNIIARPDIAVSRLNAYRAAVNPPPNLVGTDGRTFLDAAGNPQVVTSAAPLFDENDQRGKLFVYHDIDLERRVMISYFSRNHSFRVGGYARLPFRAAVLSGNTDFGPDWYEGLVNAAAADFGPCLKVADADLPQYVQFLKTPAVLKYIMTHSAPVYSAMRGGYADSTLVAEAGGVPLRWVRYGDQYWPSFAGLDGNADIYTHRALWHYDSLRDAGASLMIHGGCDVNSVLETQTDVYTSGWYGHWNNAEGILWYTNCLALLSRAKGFYDAPNGFADGYRLSDRANFGSCWKSYFNAQANDGSLATYNIQRKRAYFWSIAGDWTLRLRNRNGFGVLALAGGLHPVRVHPNRAWVDNWNFDAAANAIRGSGDIDGDGVDEIVVTSEWGLGILKHAGQRFRALCVASRDTGFGAWPRQPKHWSRPWRRRPKPLPWVMLAVSWREIKQGF